MRFLLLSILLALSLGAADTPSALESSPKGWVSIQPSEGLKGWTRLPIPPDPLSEVSQWKVEGNTLICEGNRGHEWLRFDKETGDFILHVEFRYTPREGKPRYNSGIFIRTSPDYRYWHQLQVGGASGGYLFGNTQVNGEAMRVNLRDAMSEMRVKPAGEWNVAEVHARGRVISAWVNGTVVSEFKECEIPRGHVGLEAEGYRIEFRNLKLKQLP